MRVNGERLVETLKSLGEIGFEEGKGTSRLAYSQAFKLGQDYVKQLMTEAGMETEIDPVGNLIGRVNGNDTDIISVGSHIDTVPGGGMYDGTYGVLAGIEVIRTLTENGYKPRHTIEIIAFTEEEGNVVGGTFGSKAFTGQSQEQSAMEKISSVGISKEDIDASHRDPKKYKAYLEWHIEQGGILENKQISVGLVTGIVAIVRYMVTVKGESNHAGSTPMFLRDDALVKAAGVIKKVMEISNEIDPSMTCTVGYLNTFPGAVNVIPGMVQFPVEFRCMDTNHIRETVKRLQEQYSEEELKLDNFLWQDATKMDDELMQIIKKVCEDQKTSYMKMPSGAGHDTINMALFTPSAMLFIPSINGISHSIREYSRPEDITCGADILLNTLRCIDQKS